MTQLTQSRRIVINVLGLLCFVVSGMYFHNVLESIIVGICVLMLVQFSFVRAFRDIVKREDTKT